MGTNTLVGRDQELSELNLHYEEMMHGSGSILFLTGEAGLGKTTLVHEWWGDVKLRHTQNEESGENEPLFIEAVCSIPIGGAEVGVLEALQPWADILSQLHTVEHNDKRGVTFDLKKLLIEAAPSLLSLLPGVGTAAWIIAEGAVGIHDALGTKGEKAAASQQQIFQAVHQSYR